tara:strand:- start:2403 stop:2591 length:189 start_codon:yes stop_codon:yes gene_type:complete
VFNGTYQTIAEAHQDILDYIVMFYNSRQLDLNLDCNTSNDYESAMAEIQKSASLGRHKLLDH